ncbi:MAG TPA: GIY-YIG nuclease family protein [Thermoanaerobaculia bacterium]
MKQHEYFVYMMANRNSRVLYVGVTNSLHIRVWQHKNGATPGFTKQYNCDCLVYLELFEDVREAIAREKQIKSWRRSKKDALVTSMNPEWKDLAAEWYVERLGE